MEENAAVSKLEMTIARAFKLRGKSRLSRTEFIFALAYELKWFTPEESKLVLDAALEQGLLKEAGEKLVPAFSVKNLDIPADFKPAIGIIENKSLLDRILDILEAGTGRKAALEKVKEKQDEYGGLITPETAALIVAREKKLSVEPYVDEAYRRLIEKTG